MSSPPRVSVVIPAFDRGGEIRASVESVLRQSLGDLEVIVVDDASSDDTAARVAAIDDPRVKLVRHEVNRGGSAARNTGIAAARAEWVAFQDSDDEWLPTKLDRQFAAMERLGPGAIGAYCGMIVWGGVEDAAAAGPRVAYHPQRIALPMEGMLRASLLQGGSLISTQTLIARKDALQAVGGFDEALKALQDWDCVIRLSACGPIAFVDAPLVIQRFSANSLTRSRRNRTAALERIIGKHEAELRRTPRVLARHLHTLAGGRRLIGDMAEARRQLLRALRLDPWRARSWLALVAVSAASLRPPRR